MRMDNNLILPKTSKTVPLKLVILMGFKDSGKTTILHNVCNVLTGTGSKIYGWTGAQASRCSIGGRMVNVYFGFDGDDYSIIDTHIQRIDSGVIPSSTSATILYDYAILSLRRATYFSGSLSYVWGKWIDWAIDKAKAMNPTSPFGDHERFYAHTHDAQLYGRATRAPLFDGQTEIERTCVIGGTNPSARSINLENLAASNLTNLLNLI